MQNLGLTVPNEFKISATYALSHRFNDLVVHSSGFIDAALLQEAYEINLEAKKMGVTLDKTPSNDIFARKILKNINRLVHSFERQQAEAILEIFDYIEKLDLDIDISEAQNVYFNKIYHRIGDVIETIKETNRSKDKDFVNLLLQIGTKLNINTEFYKIRFTKI